MVRAVFLLCAVRLLGADSSAASAQQKIDLIESGQAAPGSLIRFSPTEINAWVRAKAPVIVPEGLRNPSVELGVGTATGSALVDFLKMRHAAGKSSGWIMSRMLEGERALKVLVRLESSHGRCTVYLTRVELNNAVATGALLDFMVQTFFRPLYPEARINEPFELSDHMDSIDIQPSGVRVTMKR